MGQMHLSLHVQSQGMTCCHQQLSFKAKDIHTVLQVMLFMRTFIFNAHDAARLMKANLEHDHYQAASVANVQEDPKQLWQGVMVSHQCLLQIAPGLKGMNLLSCTAKTCLGSE